MPQPSQSSPLHDEIHVFQFYPLSDLFCHPSELHPTVVVETGDGSFLFFFCVSSVTDKGRSSVLYSGVDSIVPHCDNRESDRLPSAITEYSTAQKPRCYFTGCPLLYRGKLICDLIFRHIPACSILVRSCSHLHLTISTRSSAIAGRPCDAKACQKWLK